MAVIRWKEEFKLGVASIDYEHETLINLLNALIADLEGEPSKKTVADVLGEVHAKIAAHFALEEQIMREQVYDQYEEHKADHEDLLDDIRDIMDDFEDNPEGDYTSVLSDRLQNWFGEHFRTHDARLHTKLHIAH